jgi:Bacteriophage head to tail connecting protein
MPSLLESATSAKPLITGAILIPDTKGGRADQQWLDLRQKLEQDVVSLQMFRFSWWIHWAELAKYILPRRYHWLVVANRTNRGFPINQYIIDPTGTIAARNLASGMLAGMASPTRPWFKFTVADEKLMQVKEVKMWLETVQNRIYHVLSRSNFYDCLSVMYFDLVVFGTAVMIIYDDPKSIIRCYNPCAGEYYLGTSARLQVDTMARKFTFTINQIVEMFGIDNVTASTKSQYESRGASGQTEKVISHVIQPNIPSNDSEGKDSWLVPKKFKWREVYWEWGSGAERPLAIRGFNECPFIAPRWDTTSNDAYGRGPAMDALPDIKQLQFETARKNEGIEKEVRPPMVADVSLKNAPTSTLPGGITFASNLGRQENFKPAYQVTPKLNNITEDIKLVQERIKNIFFNDFLLMISQLDTVRTATEIDERREEKMLMLGPVVERNQGEALDPSLERVYAIMDRKGMFPPPPPIIAGMPIQIQYVSKFAQAQRATVTTSIERFFQFTGSIGAAVPDAFDNADIDRGIQIYGDALHVPAAVVRDQKEVAQMRLKRQKDQQQQQMLQESMAGAQGAKTLSEADVGGGQNALQMMLGSTK